VIIIAAAGSIICVVVVAVLARDLHLLHFPAVYLETLGELADTLFGLSANKYQLATATSAQTRRDWE
jgi:hypothetical protein